MWSIYVLMSHGKYSVYLDVMMMVAVREFQEKMKQSCGQNPENPQETSGNHLQLKEGLCLVSTDFQVHGVCIKY